MAQVSTFGVARFREHTTRNGVAFAGTVVRTGQKRIGTFEQDGDGGATRFYFDEPTDRSAFESEVTRLFPDAWEPADQWIIANLDGSLVALV